jgi:hypothetical protein
LERLLSGKSENEWPWYKYSGLATSVICAGVRAQFGYGVSTSDVTAAMSRLEQKAREQVKSL